MYVLEPKRSEKGYENFDIAGLVNDIRQYNIDNYGKRPDYTGLYRYWSGSRLALVLGRWVEKMFNFVGEIGDYARRTSPNANTQYLIVAQNAPDLYDEDPERYVDLVDAIAEEAIWYEGYADADWNDSRGYNYKTKNWYPDGYKYVLETLPEIKKRMPDCTRRSLSHLSKTPYPRGYKPKDY